MTLAISFGIWYSFSVFFLAIVNEFGWSRAATGGVHSIFMVVHSFVAILIGSLHDRFGPRRVIPFGSVFIVIGLLGTIQIKALWQLYLFYGLVTAIGICSIGDISHYIFLPNWFLKKRGLAIGISMAGTGVGMAVLVPIIQHIISHLGWRAAYCTLAVIVLAVVIPLNSIFQRKNPEEVGELPDGNKKPIGSQEALKKNPEQTFRIELIPRDWTLGNALRTSRFWFLFFIFFFTAMVFQGTLIHQVAHVVNKGFSAEIGAFFLGLAGIIGSAGRIFFGYLSDKLGRERAFSIGVGCAFFGILSIIALRPGYGSLLYGYAILFGLGYGSIPTILASRTADLFQGTQFGKIFGFLAIAIGLGGATGSWLSGKIFDLFASYLIAFLIILSALILMVALFLLTSPAQRGTRSEHIKRST
ncbi:MAG: MFS transporter [bacterium]